MKHKYEQRTEHTLEKDDRFYFYFDQIDREISLYRLEMCAKMAKTGVTFKPNTPSAVTCEDIVVNIPPNQVIPHTHKLK